MNVGIGSCATKLDGEPCDKPGTNSIDGKPICNKCLQIFASANGWIPKKATQ